MLGDVGVAGQHTLAGIVGCRGIGLHSGRSVNLRLLPAPAGTGIRFRRADAGAEIAALWSNTIEAALSTVLSNREAVRIGTVEHLMAALGGCAIDNAIVEIDGPEVPILDGSAEPFVALIERAGVVVQDAARRAVKVLKPVSVRNGGSLAALLPSHSFSMSFAIEFENPLIRSQQMTLGFEPGTFKGELSRARSFCVIDDLDRMRAAGLARGGSLDNAVVVSGDRVLNADGLRYRDEFVRHKLLDAFGDLYLAGGPLIGHFRGVRSGHSLTRQLLAALFADRDAWCWTTLAEGAEFGAMAWPEAFAAARL